MYLPLPTKKFFFFFFFTFFYYFFTLYSCVTFIIGMLINNANSYIFCENNIIVNHCMKGQEKKTHYWTARRNCKVFFDFISSSNKGAIERRSFTNSIYYFHSIHSRTEINSIVYITKTMNLSHANQIKRKLSFNQSELRIKDLRLIFLICVQTQILCNRAPVTYKWACWTMRPHGDSSSRVFFFLFFWAWCCHHKMMKSCHNLPNYTP